MINIALIGMRGAGKTTVGRILAALLNQGFVDCDDCIESRAGMRVREIFELRGEAEFRRLETDVLSDLLSQSGQIISTGGGIVLAAENRRRLTEHATCVWLRASVDTMHRRLLAQKDGTAVRPPLTTFPLSDELRIIAEQRAPLYAEIARHMIDTDLHSEEQAAQAIVEAIRASR